MVIADWNHVSGRLNVTSRKFLDAASVYDKAAAKAKLKGF